MPGIINGNELRSLEVVEGNNYWAKMTLKQL